MSEGARPARHDRDPPGGETPPLEGARPAHHERDVNGGETPPLRQHKGWYVPRALPHFDAPRLVQAITFRLGDALPRDIVAARRDEGDAAHRRRIAAALDAGHGACLLHDPALAGIIETALFHGGGRRDELLSWVIMPNHVHVLIAPAADNSLPDIVHTWKSWTAKAINRHRGSSGPVWQREYFDRFMRDDGHLAATIAYIEENPVKAGLAARPADWRFGSAWWRQEHVGGRASRAP
jgi:putative DNA methylase